MAIVLPADAVAQLYKTTNCGLPTALDPNTIADATYGVIEKMELQVQKDPRIRIISVIPDGSASGNKGRAGAPAAAAAPSGAGGAAAAARKPESKRRSAGDSGPQRVITDFATVRTREPDPPEEAQAVEEAATDSVAAAPAAAATSPARKSTNTAELGPMLDLDWASFEVHGQRHHIGMTVEGRRLVSASMCGNQLTVVTEPTEA